MSSAEDIAQELTTELAGFVNLYSMIADPSTTRSRAFWNIRASPGLVGKIEPVKPYDNAHAPAGAASRITTRAQGATSDRPIP